MAQSLGDFKLRVLLEILKAEGDAKKFTHFRPCWVSAINSFIQ